VDDQNIASIFPAIVDELVQTPDSPMEPEEYTAWLESNLNGPMRTTTQVIQSVNQYLIIPLGGVDEVSMVEMIEK